ncbi:cyclin-K [Sitophilus oryzae]|uniref:Cyclin-K n=1 Tax=Sitophilus oryzae TaxID=7048 RepID=A0A6J2XVN9_SITOR|nr:cyclin-K [Sitophilus oryzae]
MDSSRKNCSGFLQRGQESLVTQCQNDNIQTLGGLTKSDIWLAENHLLVIKGGTLSSTYDDTKQEFVDQIWQPIDDYNAPLHQVKIPKNPKIPPPFPVQLSDDGPLQILGTNSSRTLNETAETPAYALPPPPGWDGEIPPQSQYFPPQAGSANTDSPYITPGQAPMRGSVSGEPPGGLPFPPAPLNGSLPPYFAHLPPGAVVLPAPIGNETDPGILDEEDPSIYYPPPYSFYYPKDNSSVVSYYTIHLSLLF